MSVAAANLLWEKGEGQVKNGDVTEGLLSYQRAKHILITESQGVSGITAVNDREKKLVEDTLKKLSNSIEKNMTLLSSNPILALKLARGFSRSDIKKSYRCCALKCHPDKNRDCDSSGVFTVIQAAYEKLMMNSTIEFPSVNTSPTPRPPPSYTFTPSPNVTIPPKGWSTLINSSLRLTQCD